MFGGSLAEESRLYTDKAVSPRGTASRMFDKGFQVAAANGEILTLFQSRRKCSAQLTKGEIEGNDQFGKIRSLSGAALGIVIIVAVVSGPVVIVAAGFFISHVEHDS
jgi:hypothetical protein